MGYVLEKQQKGDDKWERCNDFLVPVLSYTVRGLTEAKSYSFRVRAENAAGVSEPSRNTPFVKASDAVGKELTRLMSPCTVTCSGQVKKKLFSLFRSSKGLPEWQPAVRPQRQTRHRDLPHS